MSLLSRLAVQAARAYGILSSRSTNISADYLVVAGGGGGGGGHGGGGGAGGFRTSTATLSTLNTYSIAVGAGGLGGINYSDPTSRGSSGSDSSISGTGLSTVTSTGGGGGGGYATNSGIGASGGSGGGGAGQTTSAGGSGTSGQGNSGGSGVTSAYAGAGGGGGASASGGNGSGTVGGTGGAGTASSISGSSVTYAGGGGGGIGVSATGGTGGAGGGGNGSSNGGTTAGGNGTVNTGGGGGGGGGDFPMNFRGGTGGSGIVIISYTATEPKFVGGTITTSGGKQIHTFTSSGTLSPITPITASYLVVAGGGGGATNTSAGASGGVGGGGAGGLLTSSTTLYSGATYIVTVGAGGAGGTTSGASGSQGSTSSLGGTGLTTISTTGGGFGAGTIANNGGAGGSGGGAYGFPLNTYNGGAGTTGQGNAGARGFTDGSTYTTGGGGGGAGAAATQKTNNSGGDGGIGITSSITGTSTYYAGGGGGGAGPSGSGGTGGLGGGGNGSVAGASASAGTPNTGGGGGGVGGGSSTVFTGGNGGSGTVIISYAGSQVFNGGLVTSSGGNTIHTFTSTGALTPLTNNLNNSLRFRASASAYLSRTPASAGNRKTWTWSGWVKRAPIQGSANTLATFMGCTTGSTDSTYLRFGFYQDKFIVGNNSAFFLQSTPLYRDPSAWYHVVVSTDTNQGSASNRMRVYINGNEVTAWSTDQRSTYLTSSVDLAFNQASQHSIGSSLPNAGDYFDGYMTDINFIDGQQLEPYYFGNNDANGVWKPIQYKGTYGTNGFYLTFGNTTSTTTLGYDSSPNGNNWTCNNISLTAGTTYDAMTDVPTNTSATVANYCVLNPLDKNATGVAISSANLKNTTSSLNVGVRGTMAVSSGKWYWETTITTSTNTPQVGIATKDWGLTYVGSSNGVGYLANATKYVNGTGTSYGATFTTGDIIGVALDMDGGSITFYKNNVSQGSAATGLSGEYFPAVAGQASDVTDTNFGQRPFAYTPPTGYVALNTYNFPTPTILQGNKYMDATLYTADTAGGKTITNSGSMQPDLVWIKNRDNVENHYLMDAVRGAGTNKYLQSNTTSAETSAAFGDALVTPVSNGFSITDSNYNAGEIYFNGRTYVAWQWKANGAGSSNTAGTITSTVSVNTTAGFSVVTYAGTLTSAGVATVGHGLGVAPKMIISKSLGTSQWVVQHTSLTSPSYFLYLNTTDAQDNKAGNGTMSAPTSTVFSTNWTTGLNVSGSNLVAYCFAEISGFSKFGSYTGNGSTDGPFVFTNFRPKYILVKSTGTASWFVIDTARLGYNSTNNYLLPNATTAETTYNGVDILSNGFKVRNTDSGYNDSGVTYIYAAFAEHPFKNSNAR